jgi:hypothetical protein
VSLEGVDRKVAIKLAAAFAGRGRRMRGDAGGTRNRRKTHRRERRPGRMPALMVSVIVALIGLTPLIAEAAGFTVDFSWSETGSCFDPKSPPFSLAGVPAGTTRLKFAMKDLDAPNFPHGGGTVAYAGENRITRGAFSYQGPCPPFGQHTYQWTVEAQDDAGRTLATATVAKPFPPR